MSEHVLIERNGPVQIIRLNRADKKNAITRAMYATMAKALIDGDADDAVRVHVFLGVPGAFRPATICKISWLRLLAAAWVMIFWIFLALFQARKANCLGRRWLGHWDRHNNSSSLRSDICHQPRAVPHAIC